MKGYVKKALKQFLHKMRKKPVHGPTKFVRPEYGQRVQYAKNENKKTKKLTNILLFKGAS